MSGLKGFIELLRSYLSSFRMRWHVFGVFTFSDVKMAARQMMGAIILSECHLIFLSYTPFCAMVSKSLATIILVWETECV